MSRGRFVGTPPLSHPGTDVTVAHPRELWCHPYNTDPMHPHPHTRVRLRRSEGPSPRGETV